jgi:4-hydroxy-tetrahydrodipicolinate reductase
MGSQVAALADADPRFVVAGRLERRTSDAQLAAALKDADAAVDFSTPEASLRFSAAAAKAGRALIVGTTGFSPAQRARLEKSALRVPLFVAPNFSLGVNLLYRLAAQAARALKGYEAGIFELHHSAKRDAPSGTALSLAAAVEQARGDGRRVPAVSQRLGDAVGEHTLTLAGPFERLELTHRAHSRALFARGALEAALWVARKKPGLYGMDDLLGAR